MKSVPGPWKNLVFPEIVPNVLYMDFIFKNNKDALLMALHWNARIVPNHELAVETVGRYIQ